MRSYPLYELAQTIPWCITPEALDAMLQIAAHEEIDPDVLKQAMHGPKSLALRGGERRPDSQHTSVQNGVARILIDGPIYRYADLFTQVSGGVTTEALAKEFQAALDDPAVTSILFVLDSPGGEATGINELADTIYAARRKKPIAAYIEGYGASAAYWIASAAGEIALDDSALVGSIGTVISVPDPAKRLTRSIEFVSRQSPKKRPDPTTEAGRAAIQQIADDLTEVFITKVARNRKLDPSAVIAVEGGLLIGQQAVDAGLADRIASEDGMLRDMAQRAARRRVFPAVQPGLFPVNQEDRMDKGFWSNFFGGLFASAAEQEGAPLAAAAEALAPVQLTTTTTTAALAVEQSDQSAKIAELEARIAQQRQAQIATAAASFADGAVRERKAYPAEHAALVAAYVQAAQDDDARPVGGDTRTRVAQLQALVEQRPAHSLSGELIASGAGGELATNAGPQPMSEARKQALLAATPMGQAALKKARSA